VARPDDADPHRLRVHGGVYTGAKAAPEALRDAPVAIVDEDRSPLSQRIASALYPPHFSAPRMIDWSQMDPGMDAGIYTFAMVIPRHFQRDLLAGRAPQIQLNVDATRMSQAFVGSGYLQQIVGGEITEFTQRYRAASIPPVDATALRPSRRWTWLCGRASIRRWTRSGGAAWRRSSTTSPCCPSSWPARR